MRKIVFIFLMVAVLAGCSTTHTALFQDQDGSSGVSPVQLAQKEDFAAKPDRLFAPERPAKPEKVSVPVTGAKNSPRVEQPLVEEEDDISSLLQEESFQNFDIPIVFNDAVRYYVGWFTTEKRKVFGNWLARARRYVPLITDILRERGMPEDLVYLAMIESGFNPKAYSTAKACGPWQFIYTTGERYGLKVNFWIDERRDPEKSTVAAAKYLRDLFNQFGCWYLAAAGYNAGEGRVGRAIERHNTNDFWELSRYNALPKETREYIPKLIAAAIIAKEPEKFGFGSVTYDAPLKFSELTVPKGTPLSAIAKASNHDVMSVRSYNPEIIRGITPPDIEGYRIKLPYPIVVAEFNNHLNVVLRGEKKIRSVVAYKVKKKDTMATIVKRHKVTQEEIFLVNACDGDFRIKPGMVVNIPRFSAPSKGVVLAGKNAKVPVPEFIVAKADKAPKQEKVPVPAMPAVKGAKAEKAVKQERVAKREGKTEQKTLHVVKKGETLASISERYNIDVASLKAGNNLKSDRVVPNMRLKLVSHREKKAVGVKYHLVRKGETLKSISGRYGVDIASLKAENNLKSDKVHPKMKLKIMDDAG